MRQSVHWALLIGWAASILVALLLHGQRQLSDFDPDGVLLYASTSPQFDSNITSLLKAQNVKAGSVVHIGSESDCYCDVLATAHRTQLLSKLKAQQYQFSSINIESVPALQRVLSAVPALMVVDERYQLRYIGPYATGFGCFTGKDLVDTVVAYTQQTPYQGAVVNADAQGCFCS